ncbi:MAG TPA: hypothetical protein VHP35_18840 [Terriglobia bacterium]|nr:hypothetical protein [Terriglobia bacterium]
MGRCTTLREEYVGAGIAPGGTHANWRFLNEWVNYDPDLTKEEQLILCDAQTSGGLLAAVPPGQAEVLLASLQAAGVTSAAAVGRIETEAAGRIRVSREPLPE